jgi:MYXO-CTERM domain-containing protein
MTYTCYRCEPAEQGAGGQPNEAGAGGQATGAKSGSGPVPSEPKPESDDGGGCSVAQAPGGAGALVVALGALGLAIAGWRRRRSLFG